MPIFTRLIFKEEGIVICVNDEHPEKAYSPNEVTEERIAICANSIQPKKAEYPIEVTEEGNVICSNAVQYKNNWFGITIFFFLHF